MVRLNTLYIFLNMQIKFAPLNIDFDDPSPGVIRFRQYI